MKLKKKDKIQLVHELTDKLKKNNTFLITNYEGLSSRESNELRLKFFDEGIQYKAVKKKLINFALENAGLKGLDVVSKTGQLAIAWGDDSIELAKIIANFGKEKKIDIIVGGFLEGEFLAKDRIITLSNLPSLDVVRAQFVGVLSSTISSFLNILNGNQRKLVLTLDAIAKSR